jgi:hypothetical protein
VCRAWTTCLDNQWETVAPGTHNDRECKWHYRCNAIEWEVKTAGTHHDRVCSAQQQCTHVKCKKLATTRNGVMHEFIKVYHSHHEHSNGFRFHHCSYVHRDDPRDPFNQKNHGYCLCLCNSKRKVDFSLFQNGQMRQMPTGTLPPTPSPTPEVPTPVPAPIATTAAPEPGDVTDAAQCLNWVRLAVVPETVEGSSSVRRTVSYMMNNAALWSAGRLIVQNKARVLLRVMPSNKPRSDEAEFKDSTYPPGSALYILDSRSPFASNKGRDWACGGFCYDGAEGMQCANSENTALRGSSGTSGEHWVHNGGATQGPCGFGTVNQRWDGNLNTWDVCSEFKPEVAASMAH